MKEKIDMYTQEKSPCINKNLDKIFELNPELSIIGSKEQYQKYLQNIFPESQVKDIVWHASLKNFKDEEFKDESHFGTFAQAKSRVSYIKQVKTDFNAEEYFYPVLLNIKNLKHVKDADYNWKEEVLEAKKEQFDGLEYTNQGEIGTNGMENSYVVFNPEQIHTLGSTTDKEGFEKFTKIRE